MGLFRWISNQSLQRWPVVLLIISFVLILNLVYSIYWYRTTPANTFIYQTTGVNIPEQAFNLQIESRVIHRAIYQVYVRFELPDTELVERFITSECGIEFADMPERYTRTMGYHKSFLIPLPGSRPLNPDFWQEGAEIVTLGTGCDRAQIYIDNNDVFPKVYLRAGYVQYR